MKITNEFFKKYEKMIYSHVFKQVKRYKIDFEDLFSYALERFTEACNTYNPQKGSFSTHLHYYLLRLSAVAYNMNRENKLNISIDEFSNVLESMEFEKQRFELLDSINNNLSRRSQMYLTDLFKGVFTEPTKRGKNKKFNIKDICDRYDYRFRDVKAMRKEITRWWRSY